MNIFSKHKLFGRGKQSGRGVICVTLLPSKSQISGFRSWSNTKNMQSLSGNDQLQANSQNKLKSLKLGICIERKAQRALTLMLYLSTCQIFSTLAHLQQFVQGEVLFLKEPAWVVLHGFILWQALGKTLRRRLYIGSILVLVNSLLSSCETYSKRAPCLISE